MVKLQCTQYMAYTVKPLNIARIGHTFTRVHTFTDIHHVVINKSRSSFDPVSKSGNCVLKGMRK